MRKFILISCLFALPFVILLFPYFVGDPFKAMRHYDVYYDQSEPFFINNNRGYVSTQMYIQNYDKYHFNSFIFGSSRSGYYRIAQWKKYLPKEANCFHFDGYGESLYQIHKKILFLDSINAPINNVLICIDEMVLSTTEPFHTHLHFLPPPIVSYKNYLSFQFSHIRAYLEPRFLVAYWDYFFTGMVKQYMFESEVFEARTYDYDCSTNEIVDSRWEHELIDSLAYSESIMKQLYVRADSQLFHPKTIKPQQLKLLSDIKSIFDKHNTNYKIIINPIYDQKQFTIEDMNILISLFSTNIYDFSGINIYTYDYHNYSDQAHFRARIASDIMRIIYEPNNTTKQRLYDSIFRVPFADIRNSTDKLTN